MPRRHAPMHEHLRDVGPVRLVVGQGGNDLHRPDDAAVVAGHEQHASAARHAGGDAAPEPYRLVAGQREHEVDGRTAFDAVDQDVRQLFDICIGRRGQQVDGNAVRTCSGHHGINPPRRSARLSG